MKTTSKRTPAAHMPVHWGDPATWVRGHRSWTGGSSLLAGAQLERNHRSPTLPAPKWHRHSHFENYLNAGGLRSRESLTIAVRSFPTGAAGAGPRNRLRYTENRAR